MDNSSNSYKVDDKPEGLVHEGVPISNGNGSQSNTTDIPKWVNGQMSKI